MAGPSARRLHPALFAIPLLIALASAATAAEPQASGGPGVVLTECRLQHPDRLQSIEARCGELRVAENPDEPKGEQIALRIAVVPAVNRRGPRDPLFILAGGPGQAASEFYAAAAGAFARIQRDRDIVLVDQRGTGGSNALNCEFPDEDEFADLKPEQLRAEAQQCLDSLRGNPVYYTTSIAVRDLEQVRAALGYERVNFYGVSYGTRVAQHYMRRYPERTRAAILDGVVPPEQILAVDSSLQAQRALDLILGRCHTDSACYKAFGDPTPQFDKLRTELASAAAEVTMADPVTGVVTSMSFGLSHLQIAVRLLTYASDRAAILPLLLHEAVARRNLAPLAAQARLVTDSLSEALSYGMHNAVACAEDAPFFDSVPVDRRALQRSYLGALQLDGLKEVCKIWPRGVMDADFHAPLNSSVPVLLLSGSADPVTPPSYAEQALKGLRNGLHLVLEGQGHGQLGTGCVPKVMADFIDRGSAENLDVLCIKAIVPAPFFTSFAGPGP